VKRIEAYCSIKSGVLDLDKPGLTRQLKQLKDGQYQLTIEAMPNRISDQQRRYFFGVVVRKLILGWAQDGVAMSIEETTDTLKDLFIHRIEWNKVLQRNIKVPISLSRKDKALTKSEFDSMKDAIQHHAITVWGINIPEPNEIDYSTK
jgi:hypothetical protein